jgi:hypothetical protein
MRSKDCHYHTESLILIMGISHALTYPGSGTNSNEKDLLFSTSLLVDLVITYTGKMPMDVVEAHPFRLGRINREGPASLLQIARPQLSG